MGACRGLLSVDLVTELLTLALQPLASSQEINRAMLRRGHEPGAGIVGDARLRPSLERGDERVLRELLGETDVANDACETGAESGRFDPKDRLDSAMRSGRRHRRGSDPSSATNARLAEMPPALHL